MDLDTALERIEKDVYDIEAHNSALTELQELGEQESLLGLLAQSYANVYVDPKFVSLPESADDEAVEQLKQIFATLPPTSLLWHIKHLQLLSLTGDSTALLNAFKRLFTWHYRPRSTRLLWEEVAKHFNTRLEDEADKQLFREAFQFVLGLPHFQHELTFSEYKDFLHNQFSETTPKYPAYQAAVKLVGKIEQDGGEYIVSQRFYNNQNDAKLVLGCMMESAEDVAFDPTACEQILQYLGHVDLRKLKLFKGVNIPMAMKEVATLAVRFFPRDGKSWFNAALVTPSTDIEAVLQAPIYAEPSKESYTDWSWLVRARLLYLDIGSTDVVDGFIASVEAAQSTDISVEKAILGYYLRVGQGVEFIRDKFKQLTRSKPYAIDLWLMWIDWERRYPKDTNSIQQVYQQALKQVSNGVFEDGRSIVGSYQDYLSGEGAVAVHSLASNYFNAGFFVDDSAGKEEPQSMEVDSVATPAEHIDAPVKSTIAEPTRDREHLTVIMANLPQETTEEQIITFFSECGEPRNSILNLPYAVIEFSSHDEKLAALTRDHKKLGDQEVRVTDGYHTTVYVTNFDVNDTEQTLREQFGAFGEIASVRLPSLSVNKHRRFCYIQFTNSVAAEAAVQFGKDSDSGIVVEISDPSRAKKEKEKKEAANPESTVYISRLNYDTSAEEIETAFGEFGTVTNLTIPNKGQDLGTKKNLGFAFLSFSTVEAANESLILNGSDILGKNLLVSIADKPRNKRPRPAPASVSKERFVPRKRKVLGASRDARGSQGASSSESTVASSSASANRTTEVKPEGSSAPKSNSDFRSFLK
ncbi:putative RNA-binding protein [Yarrowia sp. C11]|nr:putative RNA-binding protein [Yarrowia sp. C11]